ncbi:peptide MFS transporter [Streptomyces morookaense]|uniref:Peptide MFS transporter n=1 Tax=Streptomyces morookaense TaxID=1970 RepID=A0A7Y7B540_STRMO|nr:peptide MFS transporter [Streptomyces morookaense]NVK79147.1 peptide MFS transporter [Streptomyces morookaense]GHF28190.1 peptide transporter [Streptomyces morookaense]
MSGSGGGTVHTPRGVLGQPRWFVTLFLTDMWERFSFFGMHAILVLFAVAAPQDGGLGLPRTQALALFGAYVGVVFIAAMPGGWVGDRILGERRSTLVGGVVIATGHYTMLLPSAAAAYAGLALIACGTGLLKPNMLALLGRFFGPGRSAEREATLSVFYVSIQISALAAPLVTGFLGETVDWHLGFGAAGVGMTFGVIQFAWGSRSFGDVGREPGHRATPAEVRRAARATALAVLVVAALVCADVASGAFGLMHVVAAMGLLTMVAPVLCFLGLRRNAALGTADRARVTAFGWVLAATALFWMYVIQASSLLGLFAKRSVDRHLAGFELPASWFQSATPLFMLLIAPVAAWLWTRSGDRVSLPVKMALGLGAAAAGMAVMSGAAVCASDGSLVSPLWLVAVFFLLACGEVVLAPVGLSASADIAPGSFAGRTMGLYWMCSALGAGVGSQLVHLVDVLPQSVYFLVLSAVGAGAAAALLAGRRALTARLTVDAGRPEAAERVTAEAAAGR